MRRGLSTKPKRFLPKYFYDQLGSQLFEAICLLPEYYLTRAENEILERYADEIVSSVDGEMTLVEMGSGSASKTRLIIEALLRKQPELLFIPVDISASALDSSSRILLQSYPQLKIEAYAADYFAGLAELGKTTRAAHARAFPRLKHQQLRSGRSAEVSARAATGVARRRRTAAGRRFEKRQDDA